MMFWFLLGKVIEIPLVLFVLLQMKELQKGSKRIAEGDLSQPIDTSRLKWEFKRHGENLNCVSESISRAVDKQLKSERFKTELITNVSHDIKTPLTSIINYVDLIKKEEITDATLLEYVDVLDRQSARLKKLIDDLMEASKASTGNLPVQFEECDIEVLLTQLVGEFEDKLSVNELELIVDKPETPVVVKADGRHMWRVLDNLMNNACKYAQPHTRVYVSLKQEGTITVSPSVKPLYQPSLAPTLSASYLYFQVPLSSITFLMLCSLNNLFIIHLVNVLCNLFIICYHIISIKSRALVKSG